MAVTPRDPSPTPWLITAGIAAYGVGSLFRTYQKTGAGLYRMFGTIGIVIIGLLATKAIAAASTAGGRHRLREALEQLPEGFLLVPEVALTDAQGKQVPIEYLLVGRGAIHLVAIDETPRHTRTATARRRNLHTAARLWDGYKLCHRLLERQQISSYTVQPTLLTTLRPPGQEFLDGVPLIQPEELSQHLLTVDMAPDPRQRSGRVSPCPQSKPGYTSCSPACYNVREEMV